MDFSGRLLATPVTYNWIPYIQVKAVWTVENKNSLGEVENILYVIV